MKKDSRKLNEPPKRSILEEVGNAVTHGVGALCAIAGLVLLILKSRTSTGLFCSIVYGFCLVMMFLMSCLYHSFRWGSTVKRVWRRFDYISIYLLIGGTFTPMWLLFWGGQLGTILCCVQWAIIITGIPHHAVHRAGLVRPDFPAPHAAGKPASVPLHAHRRRHLHRGHHSLCNEEKGSPFPLAFLRLLRCGNPLVRHLFLPVLIYKHNSFVLFC